eukprot:CAMPEP_0171065184 /NCGR_PEP_ID=MMETSP0766_2-20121228/6699_1 /TAXON_ID=439317 /ORGANISM="Gambierdiscus australes, Strain CAWD 149" /LENGTH=77 /DNA_ID=CAMNT_0011521261 /DNA_START=754 /DNA_END=983 /DNA_ORIENTATION=-
MAVVIRSVAQKRQRLTQALCTCAWQASAHDLQLPRRPPSACQDATEGPRCSEGSPMTTHLERALCGLRQNMATLEPT